MVLTMSLRKKNRALSGFAFLVSIVISGWNVLPLSADELPGKGISVQPVKSTIAEEAFQTMLVMKALQKLGYDVKPMKDVEYKGAHKVIAKGEATFMANHWYPLHVDFYSDVGGDKKLYRKGTYSKNALQGYLIDKKTADRFRITKISQLKDPRIAKLFDIDGDGKADLTGCNKGWACGEVIKHHIKTYKLKKFLTQHQGNYAELIAKTIERYKAGKPVLYYTWTPYWISGVLVPNEDVVWLQVPFSSLPGAREDVDTTLPDGKNYGFQGNNQRIIANKVFIDNNPAAAKLFEIMKLPNKDISKQNSLMHKGEKSIKDIERHVDAWIVKNQQTFDGWVKIARTAVQ